VPTEIDARSMRAKPGEAMGAAFGVLAPHMPAELEPELEPVSGIEALTCRLQGAIEPSANGVLRRPAWH
jgi:hypothetical protein